MLGRIKIIITSMYIVGGQNIKITTKNIRYLKINDNKIYKRIITKM